MDDGWIKLHRKFTRHWLYTTRNQPFTFQEAWIDILLNVNYETRKINIGNQLLECKPGESLRSIGTWAKSWKWTESKARRFLKLLEKDRMISVQGMRGKSTRLIVCNWDTYNPSPTEIRRKSDGSSTINKKKDKKGKKEELRTKNKNTVAEKPQRTLSARKKDPKEPMTRDQFIANCLKSPQRHVKIIGMFTDELDFDFKTRAQWDIHFKRHTKAAAALAKFDDTQIGLAMTQIDKAKKDYLHEWTLETVLKKLR